jgi:hypothetical protein
MSYTFDQLKDALNECTACDLYMVDDEDADMTAYALIDPYGEIDGDLFYDLDDVADYITNNDQVREYLFSSMV